MGPGSSKRLVWVQVADGTIHVLVVTQHERICETDSLCDYVGCGQLSSGDSTLYDTSREVLDMLSGLHRYRKNNRGDVFALDFSDKLTPDNVQVIWTPRNMVDTTLSTWWSLMVTPGKFWTFPIKCTGSSLILYTFMSSSSFLTTQWPHQLFVGRWQTPCGEELLSDSALSSYMLRTGIYVPCGWYLTCKHSTAF